MPVPISFEITTKPFGPLVRRSTWLQDAQKNLEAAGYQCQLVHLDNTAMRQAWANPSHPLHAALAHAHRWVTDQRNGRHFIVPPLTGYTLVVTHPEAPDLTLPLGLAVYPDSHEIAPGYHLPVESHWWSWVGHILAENPNTYSYAISALHILHHTPHFHLDISYPSLS